MSIKALQKKTAKSSTSGNFFTRYSHWILLSPFLVLFITFIILPIFAAIGLSFTDFNGVQMPDIVFLENYIRIFSKDSVFMQYILPNTIVYAVLVGPGGFILGFIMAWFLSQLRKGPRTILAVIFNLLHAVDGIFIKPLCSIILLILPTLYGVAKHRANFGVKLIYILLIAK